MRSRLALGLAVVLAACSGGGSSSTSSVPSLPWGTFRHDNSNSAAAGAINSNLGRVTPLSNLCPTPPTPNPQRPCGATLSTPTIDKNGNLLIGTANGVISLDPNGTVRWTFDECVLSGGPAPTPSPIPVPVGSVSSSPAVTAGGTIVFGSDATDTRPGYLFAVEERGTTVECNWVLQPSAGPASGIKSSAALQIDALDLSLSSVFVGGNDGRLLAVNSDGTVRWSVLSDATTSAITSTPAVDINSNIYITSADGFLSAVEFGGRLLWRFPVGVSPAAPLLPSPAVSTTVYAIGSAASLFAVNPNGTQKWQFTPPNPTSGSPAYLSETFNQGASNVVDTIVYVVDTQGTAYGLRDLNGTILQLQRCSNNPNNPTQDCRTDSCPPPLACSANTDRCEVPAPTSGQRQPGDSQGTTVLPTPTPGEACSRDTCVLDNHGTCTVYDGTMLIPDAPVGISTSPVLSGDLFVVVGTSDGRVCARTLDPPYGVVPGYNLEPPTATWGDGHCNLTTSQACLKDTDCPTDESCVPGGCIELGDGLPTLSSPIIGENGTIYVTTANGLYVIK